MSKIYLNVNNAGSKATPDVWPHIDDVMAALNEDEYVGWCLSCGAERWCTEHDAENYPCEDCGKNKVQGAFNVLLLHPYSTEKKTRSVCGLPPYSTDAD